jgi:hypothetical protein
MRRRVGIGLLVVLLVAAACDGGSSEGSDDIEARQVRRFLDRELNDGAVNPVTVTDVRCPRTVTRGETARATCRVTINETPVELDIERAANGRLARREAVVVVPTLEAFVAGQYDARLGLAVIVECGPEALLAIEPGATVECTATDAEGAAVTAVATVEDLDGLVTVALA